MRFSLILRAVATSWVAILANAAVGFLLTPYVLHHLGDEAFGLWVLVVTLVGCYGLFDAGVRSSILRYASRHRALGDQERANEVIATAFYYYLCGCALVILATYLLVGPMSRFFAVHDQELSAFKSLLWLAGVVQGLTLPLVVFSASLEAAGRYDQVYVIRVASLAVRVIAVIAVVRAGGGLFGVGAQERLPEHVSLRFHQPDGRHCRETEGFHLSCCDRKISDARGSDDFLAARQDPVPAHGRHWDDDRDRQSRFKRVGSPE